MHIQFYGDEGPEWTAHVEDDVETIPRVGERVRFTVHLPSFEVIEVDWDYAQSPVVVRVFLEDYYDGRGIAYLKKKTESQP